MHFRAACTGSYDPATLGHMRVAQAALGLLSGPDEKIILGIGTNVEKTRFIADKNSVAALMLIGLPAISHDRIRITTIGTADLAETGCADVYLRGLRNWDDLHHERDAYLKKLAAAAGRGRQSLPDFFLVVTNRTVDLEAAARFLCAKGFPKEKVRLAYSADDNAQLPDVDLAAISSTLVRDLLCAPVLDETLLARVLPVRVAHILADVRARIAPVRHDAASLQAFNTALAEHPAVMKARETGLASGIILPPTAVVPKRPPAAQGLIPAICPLKDGQGG